MRTRISRLERHRRERRQTVSKFVVVFLCLLALLSGLYAINSSIPGMMSG